MTFQKAQNVYHFRCLQMTQIYFYSNRNLEALNQTATGRSCVKLLIGLQLTNFRNNILNKVVEPNGERWLYKGQSKAFYIFKDNLYHLQCFDLSIPDIL